MPRRRRCSWAAGWCPGVGANHSRVIRQKQARGCPGEMRSVGAAVSTSGCFGVGGGRGLLARQLLLRFRHRWGGGGAGGATARFGAGGGALRVRLSLSGSSVVGLHRSLRPPRERFSKALSRSSILSSISSWCLSLLAAAMAWPESPSTVRRRLAIWVAKVPTSPVRLLIASVEASARAADGQSIGRLVGRCGARRHMVGSRSGEGGDRNLFGRVIDRRLHGEEKNPPRIGGGVCERT